jgi:3-deoxy-D-manno-octulosonic acid (KDO) 8-phosphate synthase
MAAVKTNKIVNIKKGQFLSPARLEEQATILPPQLEIRPVL